jgi:hypothetical protein
MLLLKAVTAILAVLFVAETAWLLTNRHLANRFEIVPVEQWGGLVALDQGTGSLCKTIPQTALKRLAAASPTPSAQLRPQASPSPPKPPSPAGTHQGSDDSWVAALERELQALPPEKPKEDSQALLLRSLPFCWEIH